MMAAERFWTVTNRLPAEPWYERATLDVTKMEAAAKDRSWSTHSGQHKTFCPLLRRPLTGPNVAMLMPGMDSAQ